MLHSHAWPLCQVCWAGTDNDGCVDSYRYDPKAHGPSTTHDPSNLLSVYLNDLRLWCHPITYTLILSDTVFSLVLTLVP